MDISDDTLRLQALKCGLIDLHAIIQKQSDRIEDGKDDKAMEFPSRHIVSGNR